MRCLIAGVLVATLAACEQTSVQAPRTTVARKTASKTLTAAERQARFDARDAAKIPSSIPSRWHDALEALGAKPIAFGVKTSAEAGSAVAAWHRSVHFRVFGLDNEVDERLHQKLTKLVLEGLKMPLTDQDFESGDRAGHSNSIAWWPQVCHAADRCSDHELSCSKASENFAKCRRLKPVASMRLCRGG